MNNLWPEVLCDNIDPEENPYLVLKEQGKFLSDMTHGLLRAKVCRSYYLRSTDSEAAFSLNFIIEVPAIEYHQFWLMRFHHPINFYPMIATCESENIHRLKINSFDDFMRFIERVFNSDATKKIIEELLIAIDTFSVDLILAADELLTANKNELLT